MTDTRIGPSFGDELAAAGLAGLPLAWGGDGSLGFADAVTAKQRKAVQAVLAAHDPARPSRGVSLARLAELDRYIPRGLEDTWAATGFVTSSLPPAQRDRLAEKVAIRAALAQPQSRSPNEVTP